MFELTLNYTVHTSKDNRQDIVLVVIGFGQHLGGQGSGRDLDIVSTGSRPTIKNG